VVQAALLQFDAEGVSIVRVGEIRTRSQIHDIVQRAANDNGFIVHTLVSEDLRHAMLTEGRANNVPTIDIMGPLLARLTDMFH